MFFTDILSPSLSKKTVPSASKRPIPPSTVADPPNVMMKSVKFCKINSFKFDPGYEKIHPFREDDFQFSSNLPIGKAIDGDDMATPGKRLKHDACNLLHRYFEELQGTAWSISKFYRQADIETKYAIRQLNNICHEIEGWVNADRKKAFEPEWMRPSQITTFLNAPRFDLHEEDYELFKVNRHDRDLGGVYLHWSQVGKTLYEVFRDEHAPVMTDALCFPLAWLSRMIRDTCPSATNAR